jgi:hypothetical protein
MNTADKDTAFAVALVLLIAISLAAFFGDPHWQSTCSSRILWAGVAAGSGAAVGGSSR